MQSKTILHEVGPDYSVLENVVAVIQSGQQGSKRGGRAKTHVASCEAFIRTARATLGPTPRKR